MNTTTTKHQAILKYTKKGYRTWLENKTFLENAGFNSGKRYDIKYTFRKGIILTLNATGKRKVTTASRKGQARPIIDLQSNKVSSCFNVGCTLVEWNHTEKNTIIINEVK